ncbi:putative transposase [Silvimonas terrae]|uniref:Putative transposase n=1 Tax=Silvimonas terrae TaxID=300266 RepID=A0A840RFY2_9NEIS|nr:Mu transposase C-terminal domain-containing protein [Silvimonas terrae]MBB5191957.1 putative transposase [Silvimonas terrae]
MNTKTIRPGQLVFWREQSAIVLEIKGLTDAIIRTVANNKTEIVPASSLSSTPPNENVPQGAHILAAEKDWDSAVQRYELIRPLLDGRSDADLSEIAARAGKSVPTIYRWLSRFNETGLVSSLLRSPRADKDSTRIDPEIEEIIRIQIEEYYLKLERRSVAKLYKRVKEQCDAVDLDPPNKATVQDRVRRLERRTETTKRYGYKTTREKLEPLRGNFPGADFPNAVVQIDHTPVDVIVVDDDQRRPIGRPNLTLAIDTHTRMVSGFYMSLDPVGTLSAGLCIGRAVMRKDLWLAKLDIHAPWPIYGKMAKILMDNAKEFRGKTMQRACNEHDILVEHRRRAHPNYGPHIERAFRTFMDQVHELRGTTFSNVQQRAEYDSEGRACLTLTELERWFTIFLVYEYHNHPHEGLNRVPPLKFYAQCVNGTAEKPGVGVPEAVADEETFRIDFLPFEMRTIQRDGVVMDNIQYYSPVLRRWIGETEPGQRRLARKFLFARDPRDISVLYFLEGRNASMTFKKVSSCRASCRSDCTKSVPSRPLPSPLPSPSPWVNPSISTSSW